MDKQGFDFGTFLKDNSSRANEKIESSARRELVSGAYEAASRKGRSIFETAEYE